MSEIIETFCLFEINGNKYYCSYHKLSEVYYITVWQCGDNSDHFDREYSLIRHYDREYFIFSSVESNEKDVEEDLGIIKEEDVGYFAYPDRCNFKFMSLTLGYYTSPSDNSEGLKPAMRAK